MQYFYDIYLPGVAAVRCVILVATDGLFDMVNNERAIDIAFEHFGNPAGAADELVRESGE
jgi:serine/threonine protein phosphatase PrpC